LNNLDFVETFAAPLAHVSDFEEALKWSYVFFWFLFGDACQPFMFTPGDVMVSNAAINGLDFAAETPGFFCWLKC